MSKMDIAKYIDQRVKEQISYYDNRTIKYKRLHFILIFGSSALSSICPLMVFLGSQFSQLQTFFSILAAIMSATVAIMLTLDKFGKYQELYIQFRRTGENLKQQLYLYKLSTSEYSNENRDSLFVQTCENIINSEVIGSSQLVEKTNQ